MGELGMKIILYVCVICTLQLQVSSLGLSRPSEKKTFRCQTACEMSYAQPIILETEPGEDPDLGSLESCCKRGCRLYSIVEFINKSAGHAEMLRSCFDNCHDAYLGNRYEYEACKKGCKHQQPFQVKKISEDEPVAAAQDSSEKEEILPQQGLFPLLVMQNFVNNLASRATWSFFTFKGDDGHTEQLVVVHAEPKVVIDFTERNGRQFEDFLVHHGNSPLAATTEVHGQSQLKSAKSYMGEINDAQDVSPAEDPANNSDWLSCLARRTGAPRIFLCLLLMLSALSMVWLCLSAAVTAPNQHVKLSINSGDLEYIRSLPEKKGIKGVYPQATVDARPLPAKIRVEKL